MTDPIADFIRTERARLIEAAPAPNAARLWHEARRRRAASLRAAMRAAGWAIRLAVAAATAIAFLFPQPEARFLLLLLALSIWLTRGACAPAHQNLKGIME